MNHGMDSFYNLSLKTSGENESKKGRKQVVCSLAARWSSNHQGRGTRAPPWFFVGWNSFEYFSKKCRFWWCQKAPWDQQKQETCWAVTTSGSEKIQQKPMGFGICPKTWIGSHHFQLRTPRKSRIESKVAASGRECHGRRVGLVEGMLKECIEVIQCKGCEIEYNIICI